jgi:hypothetical protein
MLAGRDSDGADYFFVRLAAQRIDVRNEFRRRRSWPIGRKRMAADIPADDRLRHCGIEFGPVPQGTGTPYSPYFFDFSKD